jgi:hypothetical protein
VKVEGEAKGKRKENEWHEKGMKEGRIEVRKNKATINGRWRQSQIWNFIIP